MRKNPILGFKALVEKVVEHGRRRRSAGDRPVPCTRVRGGKLEAKARGRPVSASFIHWVLLSFNMDAVM